jgi:hypothetical protein
MHNETHSMCSMIELLDKRLGELNIKKSDICKNTSISYPTINRTFNRKRDFTILECIEVLNFMYSKDDALNIVKKYYPESDAVLNLLKDINTENKYNADQEQYLKNPKTFALTNLIELGYLDTTKKIKEVYGQEGINLATKLSLTGIITISKDGKITSRLNRGKPSFQAIREQIKNATSYHKDSNCGKFKNYIYFGTQLVSKEKRTKIYKVTRIFKELISSLIHEDRVDPKMLQDLNDEFTMTEKSNTKRTEPIYYSILFDDFHNTEYNNEVLQ